MKTCTSVAMAGLIAVIAACAPEVKTEAVQASLDPMPQRLAQTGDTFVWARGDEQISRKVVGVSGAVSTIEGSDGCGFAVEAMFAPSQSWTNCKPFADGTHSYQTEGNIFPLTVGNTVSFPFQGRNADGAEWASTRVCTVKGQARVTVPAGSFDTYHVTCNDEFTNRDFYVAPAIGDTVLFKRFRKSRNETMVQELVSFTPGQV